MKKMKLTLTDWSSKQLKSLKKLLQKDVNKALSKSSLLIKVDPQKQYVELTTNTADEFGVQAVFCIQIDMRSSDNVQDTEVSCDGTEFINFLEKCRRIAQPPHAILTFPAADEKQLLRFSINEQITEADSVQYDFFAERQDKSLIGSAEHTTPLHPQAVVAEFSPLVKHQEADAKIDSESFVSQYLHALTAAKGNTNSGTDSADNVLQLEITNGERCVIYAKSAASTAIISYPLLLASQGNRLNVKLCEIPLTAAKKLGEVISKEDISIFIEIREQHLVLYQGALTLCIAIEEHKYPQSHFQGELKAQEIKNEAKEHGSKAEENEDKTLENDNRVNLNIDDIVALLDASCPENGKHDVISITAVSVDSNKLSVCKIDFGYESYAKAEPSGESHNQMKTTSPFEEGKTYSFNLSQFQNVISALQNEPKATHKWYFNENNSGLVLCQYYENAPRDRLYYMLVLINL